MRGRVLYVGRDPDLPAFLSAYGTGGFRVTVLTPQKYRGERADLLLWDLDAAPLPPELPDGVRVVTVGYRGDAELVRPFPFSDFESLLDPDPAKGGVVLSPVGRELFVGDSSVRLSPLEYDLYAALFAVGAPVPAERAGIFRPTRSAWRSFRCAKNSNVSPIRPACRRREGRATA